ncbi:MAG: type II toxin-antitoxin system VapC family toxin [Deltaproteobacteria bacterium]|nr:MAG: type II toxin-antitoxin system VapC family toxin [Deltaproteobacteria bacterium]
MAKKPSYIDTGAFIALLDGADSYHSLFVQLFKNPPPLFTTPLVIAEGQGWFLKRYDKTRALQFMQFVESFSTLKIESIGQNDVIESTKMMRKFSDQDLTMVDACGLWLMKKHSVKICWSTDHHLSLSGISLVIHQ